MGTWPAVSVLGPETDDRENEGQDTTKVRKLAVDLPAVLTRE